MSSSPTLVTDETPESAPHAEESWHTIADQRWKLRRYTSPNWAVEKCEYEDNDHNAAKCVCLQTTLEHVAGTRVDCKPVDPWDHQPGQTIYRKHRVVVHDPPYCDRDYVATIKGDEDNLPKTTADGLRERGDDPFEGARSQFERKDHKKVREIDYTLKEKGLKFGKGNTVETLDGALWAIIGAARLESSAYQRRHDWFFGDKDDD